MLESISLYRRFAFFNWFQYMRVLGTLEPVLSWFTPVLLFSTSRWSIRTAADRFKCLDVSYIIWRRHINCWVNKRQITRLWRTKWRERERSCGLFHGSGRTDVTYYRCYMNRFTFSKSLRATGVANSDSFYVLHRTTSSACELHWAHNNHIFITRDKTRRAEKEVESERKSKAKRRCLCCRWI
jgi:hypothetical protein